MNKLRFRPSQLVYKDTNLEDLLNVLLLLGFDAMAETQAVVGEFLKHTFFKTDTGMPTDSSAGSGWKTRVSGAVPSKEDMLNLLLLLLFQ